MYTARQYTAINEGQVPLKLPFEVEKALSDAFDKYVPRNGECDNVMGELIRLINKIIYRYNNDGDKSGGYDFGLNPGAEAGIELMYIAKHSGLKDIYRILDKEVVDRYNSDKEYVKNISDVAKLIYDILTTSADKFEKMSIPQKAKYDFGNHVEGIYDYQRRWEEELESDRWY